MKRTGKRCSFKILSFFLFGLFGICGHAHAQDQREADINVVATVSETTIYTGERVSLSVEVSGNFNNVSRPELPEFEGFRLLSNNPSTSRSYSFVNGKTSSSYSYSYYLIAQDQGSYTIPAISISIDGETFTTKPIDVEIVDRNSSATSSSSSSKPDIFLQLEVSDSTPVTGQQLVANVILYFKDGLEVNSYQPVPGWKAEGFWKEELENNERPRAESTIMNGVRYRKARLLQFALFPTKTGELSISPYEIIVSVRAAASRDDPFSSFFGGFGSNQRQVELKTDPVDLTVQPLPDIDSDTYIGAVGDFDISRTISSREAIAGESVEIETTVRGTGNVPLITKPQYDLPDGLEVYDPQETSSLNRRNQNISGTKIFTDVFIARTPGSYTIPEKTVAYYNPARNQYVRETLPALSFSVTRDPNAIAATDQPMAFAIQPVTGLASWTTTETGHLTGRWWFWIGLLLPLVVLGVGYWQKTYRDKMTNNTAFARATKAFDIAEERLSRAIDKSEEGHIKEAYNLLQKALTGFIGDKLNLPEAGLSTQSYISALQDNGVDMNLIKNVRMLLDKCATISYAPDTSHSYLKSHVGLAESIIEKLKKEL